jgi:dephospho-CoA kinase
MTRYVVGLTGGIGSGKTSVSDLFAEHGIVVADSDIISRTVVEPGMPVHGKIRERFGTTILLQDETLNRAKLREIIFASKDDRRWLEKQTHGPIMKMLGDIVSTASSPYAILVLSAGSGRSTLINKMLVVDVSEPTQIERVTNRDNNSIDQVQAIMDNQPSRQERLSWADDVIKNDGTLDQLKARVIELHHHYITLSAKPK